MFFDFFYDRQGRWIDGRGCQDWLGSGEIRWYEAVKVRGVSVRTWPAVPGSLERGWVGRSMSGHWLACGDELWIVCLVGGPGATKGS